jgi:hypothetical protein
MQIRWGNAFLEANGAGWTVAKRGTENAANQVYETEVMMSVEGQWTGTPAQIVAKCSALENALTINNQDLVLIANDGSIAQRLLNAGSTTGTRCLGGVNYPSYKGAQFATYRDFNFTVQATYPIGTGPVLLDFLETVESSGSGPVIDFQLPANAAPIPVQLYGQTPNRLIQQGYAVTQGLTPVSYATPPGPLFKSSLLMAPTFKRSVKRVGAKKWECRVEWAYTMGAVGSLGGLPNSWR